MFYLRSALLVFYIILVLSHSLFGRINSDFSGGQNGDPIGAYADRASDGWSTPWLVKSNFGSPILRNVADAFPIDRGGSYLQVSSFQRGGGKTRGFIGIARQYAGTPANGVDRMQPHSISFDFRLDECGGFDSADDNITICDATDTTTTSGVGSTSSFLIRVFGSGTGKVAPGNWALFNGNRKGGGYDVNLFVDTGVAMRVGVVYRFTLRLNPLNKSYVVIVSDGGKTYVSPEMGYRCQGFGNGVIAFLREGTAGDYTSFSLDNILIIPTHSGQEGGVFARNSSPVKAVVKPVKVSLDGAVSNQKFLGFGISTAWHQGEFSEDGGRLFRELFDPSGLSLDFIRVPNDYTKDAKAGAYLNSADIIKKFRAMRPSGKVMMSAWSPPKELKTTKSLLATRTEDGRLDAALLNWECYNFSRWWVDSLKYFDAQDALPDYMSIQNEPDFLNQAWPTCIITPKLYAESLDWITKELNWNGWAYKLFVVGPETSSLAAFADYKNQINISQLRNYAVHPYDHPSDEQWQEFYAANCDKPIFMTEYDGATDLAGSAADIHRALVHGQVSAYFSWSAVNFSKDPPESGLFDITSGAKQQKYYALAHFSRWIQRDDIRIKAVSGTGDLLAVAFKKPNGVGDDNRYSVVLINKSASPREVFIVADNIKTRSIKAFVTSYAEGRYLQPMSLAPAMTPSIEIPPQSIATVLINW